MKVKNLQVFHIPAGWRIWSFIKITTDSSIVGWSECTSSHGSSRGVEGAIKELSSMLIGEDPRNVNFLTSQMSAKTIQAQGSIINQAIAGIENALLEIKAKSFNSPVYELFGGAYRDEIPLYWSHFGTSRVRAYQEVEKPRIQELKDISTIAKEFRDLKHNAIKTNIAILDGKNSYIYMPGFRKSPGGPDLRLTDYTIKKCMEWVGGLRDALGPNADIALDLNFNFKVDGYIRLAQALEEFNLSWLEIDVYNPKSLRDIRNKINIPITSCENISGAINYKPFFENYSLDVASIDVIWNGFSESIKIANQADLYNINVCPHNFNSYLSTFISAQYSSIIPNLQICEIDIDEVPMVNKLFETRPEITNGMMALPTKSGWGIEIDEDFLHQHSISLSTDSTKDFAFKDLWEKFF